MNLSKNSTNNDVKLNASLWAVTAIVVILAGCASSPPEKPKAAAAPAPAAAAPPPAWKQGMGPDMANSTLAPLAGKMTATPISDIPINKLKLPPGFKIEVWATGMPGARAMALGDNGKVYIGTRAIGRVYEVTDNGKERTNRIVVDKLVQPAGVAFNKGSLYVMAIDKVLRFDGIDKNASVTPVDLTAKFNLPPEQHHNWKYIAFGPDGKLYIPFGAPCNICEPPTAEYAQIRRYNPDGSGMEVLATGVRNSVGFDWHPTTKQLWFTNHGRDWMGDDKPNDTLNLLSKTGLNFGFPYCHQGNLPDNVITKANACQGVEQPVALMGTHVATMGIKFYTGNMFPPEYKNAALIARKGSWNRNQKSGFDVVMVKAGADGKNPKITPFITGFLNPADQSFWGRPAYLMQMPDGSMLVSDEQLGAIYRVTYSKQQLAAK
ncbi:PQQ-dependent sugar dehydrogenase [Polynucleobacter sp. IMCC30063]|uniref:PQQ-dependent sugar dehydrogenase n=1 Tax=unclassified Polynucleobacter TaxID=2640945 RepID=UPI001F1B73C8|nr:MULTISPECIES: PQQ-dependent sugar dehydrogenase [unclassified Polynucleobacter]MCE7505357.1 PQQ-dependent sugar dehydrogenase [Polynucleobacter sp. IMCC30063]MCE7527942.1 PQQ-dependent sugar dehydrogenase [Polynucleobacter sp. IMCC 30228]